MNDWRRSRVRVRTLMSLFILTVGVLCVSFVGAGFADEVTGDVIVLFRGKVSKSSREALIRRHGGSAKIHYETVRASAAHVPNEAALRALRQDPDVVAIIPDRVIHAHAQTTPAGVQRIGAAPGTTIYTGKNVGVAVVDTGIDLAHKDLTPLGAQCFTAFTSCQDDNAHGTHVTGIIAARNNTIGVVGVAPNAVAYAVKVLNAQGSGSDSTLLAGLDWIAQNANLVSPKIRVVNMSLGRIGTLDDNPALRQAVQALHAMDIAVVASAGNDPSREVSSQVPASYPEVMAISSTTALGGTNAGCKFFFGTIGADTASYFTTDGAYNAATGIGVSVSAPGEEKENISKGCFVNTIGVLSTKLGGGTTRMSGTSMAAPHVTGVVVLMWEKVLSQGGSLDPEAARTIIRDTAARKGTAPLNSPTSGYTFDGEREGVISVPGALQ